MKCTRFGMRISRFSGRIRDILLVFLSFLEFCRGRARLVFTRRRNRLPSRVATARRVTPFRKIENIIRTFRIINVPRTEN